MNHEAQTTGGIEEPRRGARGARRVFYYLSNVHRLTGAQRSLHAFLTACDARELSPVVVVPGEGPTTALFRESGLRVLVEPPAEALMAYGGRLLRAGLAERLFTGLRAVVPYSLRMARLLEDEEIEACHYNDSRALLMCGGAHRLAGIPAVWHVRGDVRGLGDAYLHACGLLADRIVLVADSIRDSVPARYRSRCVTVYNGIDPVTRPPGRSRQALLSRLRLPVTEPESVVLAVVVGSIVPFKGAHHVLSAAQELAARSSAPVLFVLVGDRPDPEYSQMIDRRLKGHGSQNVRFVGWDWEPLDWIRAADLVVLASVDHEDIEIGGRVRRVDGSEGLPRVILEAMACGRPVVATTVAGVPEQVVDGSTGLLVPPRDPQALARAVDRLGGDPERREAMGRAALERVVRIFSTAANVRATLGVYDALLGGGS